MIVELKAPKAKIGSDEITQAKQYEIAVENRARRQFFQEHLQHSTGESTTIKYLQDKHSEFLEGVIVEDAVENAGDRAEALTAEATDTPA